MPTRRKEKASFSNIQHIFNYRNFNVSTQSMLNQHNFSVALPTASWHSENHVQCRINVVRTISVIMHQRSKQLQPKNRFSSKKQFSDIMRQLELMLYARAGSLVEYQDLHTLKRRLQYVVSSLQVENKEMSSEVEKESGLKRKRETYDNTGNFRRRKTSIEPLDSCKAEFLLNDDFALIGQIFSFLSPLETLSLCSINHVAQRMLPNTVTSLLLPLENLYLGIKMKGNSLFLDLPRLQELSIVGSKNHSCPSKSIIFPPSNRDDIVMSELADLIKEKTCTKLEKLVIHPGFRNTMSIRTIEKISSALKDGGCPNLKFLCISGNSIGDDGAVSIAKYLTSSFCKKLVHLDLQWNYIGERGFKYLFESLENTEACLQDILLGGNIMADFLIERVEHLLESNHLHSVRKLGLENNFLSSTTSSNLLKFIGMAKCPKLQYFSS